MGYCNFDTDGDLIKGGGDIFLVRAQVLNEAVEEHINDGDHKRDREGDSDVLGVFLEAREEVDQEERESKEE